MLVEKQIYHGRWWLPEKPTKRTHGVLEINPSGKCNLILTLDPEHNFRDFFPKDWDKNQDLKCPRIIGLLYDTGKTVTAERVTCVYGMKNGFDTISCYPSIVCISNIDFETDDLLFDNIRLEIPGTGDFVPDSGFNFSHDDAETLHKFNVSHEPLPAIEIFSLSGLKLEAITWFSHERSNKPDNTSISIKETRKFKLSSDKPRALLEFLIDAISLNYFICMIFGKAIPIKSIDSVYDLDGEKFGIQIFAHIEPDPPENIARLTAFPLFVFVNDGDKMGEMIYHYINLRKERHAIFEAFFSSRFSNEQYVATRFFMIVTAIEGFHRQLRHSGRMSLEERLDSLFSEFDAILNIKFDWGDKSTKISEYRHQHAHIFDPEPNRDALEMHHLANMLHVVFILLFFNEAAKKCKYSLPADRVTAGWPAQFLPPQMKP